MLEKLKTHFYAAHAFLIVVSIFGAFATWAWFGPFVGMLWSGACFTFGTMFGITIRNEGEQK
ncbi:MAG TPA: hypothetical protein VFM18_17085 [Methanosarcina sp.]|nr:hypothetical protein [Methanosarcina sp.]